MALPKYVDDDTNCYVKSTSEYMRETQKCIIVCTTNFSKTSLQMITGIRLYKENIKILSSIFSELILDAC